MKTVIMAGGRGTRISSVTSDVPKPMIRIEGIPVLEREICCLRDQNFKDIILTVGHLAEQIISYFGNGDHFGVHIEYFVEEKPLGNAGALLKLGLDKDFLLLNGDAIFDVDFNRFVDYHRKKGGMVTLFTHPNSHPYDSGLIIADQDGCVKQWLTKEDTRPKWYRNRVNAGLHVMNPKVLRPELTLLEKVDLDRHILKPLCGTGQMFCYDSPEYVKDMGTSDRYESVCQDYRRGIIKARNLRNQQKAIFLDRDGTINKYVGFLRNIDDLELLQNAAKALKIINQTGYLAIVVTNQPVIARGEVTETELQMIHNKMETLLGDEGAYLDAIYYCPHHPKSGFAGEVRELKIPCDCRKPKPGMLLQASKELNIDLTCSWMVGDGENDIKAGQAAGCKTALIGDGEWGQDVTVPSLLTFCDILQEY